MNVTFASDLLQALLVASSALAGFTGIIVIEFAKLVKQRALWAKSLSGVLIAICGISFVICVNNSINWFEDQGADMSLVDVARGSFYIQLISFFMLFVTYIIMQFFSKK